MYARISFGCTWLNIQKKTPKKPPQKKKKTHTEKQPTVGYIY